jgi:hypothetical protein
MASTPDADLAQIEHFYAEQSPVQSADQLRVVPKVRGNSVTLAERRPPWEGRGPEWIDVPFAQLRCSTETTKWSLYWADRNSRWHRYNEIRPGSLNALLAEIDEDPTCMLKG